MGRELRIVWCGRSKGDEWAALCDRYRARIERFVPITEQVIRADGRGEPRARQREEGRRMLEALPEPSWVVAMDRRGKARSSAEWAQWWTRRKEEWPHPLVFLVGSDLGLDPDVVGAAHERVSFGPVTLAHDLARLVLYEQLYRALSIEAGIKYHREPL